MRNFFTNNDQNLTSWYEEKKKTFGYDDAHICNHDLDFEHREQSKPFECHEKTNSCHSIVHFEWHKN